MAILSKGMDPTVLTASADRFRSFAQECLEVSDAVRTSTDVITANWGGEDLQALCRRVPDVQRQLTLTHTTLLGLGEHLKANVKAQTTTSASYGGSGLPGGSPGSPGSGEGGSGEGGSGEGGSGEGGSGEGGSGEGGEGEGGEGEEKPGWLEGLEKSLKPLEFTATGLGGLGFGLFNHTAGGGLKDLFTNGKLYDLYAEDVLKGANTTKGLTSFENAGSAFGGAMKIMDGRALGGLFAEGSKAGSLVGKFGVLGPISIGAGMLSTGLDIAHGDYKAAALDGASTALTAGALLAPPPADIVCGVGALGIAAYQNIPFVHSAVDGTVHAVGDAATAVGHAAEDAGKAVGHAASSAWHAVTSIF